MDFWIFWVDSWKLFSSGFLNSLSHFYEFSGFRFVDVKTDRCGIDKTIDHPTIGDINRDGPQPRNIDLCIQRENKGWNILKCNVYAFAVFTLCCHWHKSSRSF
ncbi:hypothetical protein D3C80_1544800 [compost metagenome]